MNLYSETTADAIKSWDNGESVFTISMGGLGPGYEQCIQLGVIELCRALLDKELPDPEGRASQLLDDLLMLISDEHNLQLSGAQAGAIKQLAYKYTRDGWDATIQDFKKTLGNEAEARLIQVCNHWPGKEPVIEMTQPL